MPYVTVDKENTQSIDLYYEDKGEGQPVVLIHGFPFDNGAWEKQETALLAAGYRVITYDRRGFGKSSHPSTGFEYDTFASDLDKLLTKLDVTDVVLVGHSMGTGEVTRYIGTYGTSRVSKAVLVSPLQPFLLKTDDNPTGLDQSVFDGIKAAIAKDRYVYYHEFLDDFYNLDQLLGNGISQDVVDYSWNVATTASPIATYQSVDQWHTDFRKDLEKFDVPTLVIQGDQDRILPFESTGKLLPNLIKGSELLVLEGAPHGLPWSNADDVNKALLEFIAK